MAVCLKFPQKWITVYKVFYWIITLFYPVVETSHYIAIRLVNVNRHSPCVQGALVEWSLSVLIIRLATVAWRLPHWPPVWGSFWAGRLLKKLNGKSQKRADFVRFATAALSSQSAPANYDKTRLLGLHIACQYGVHINIACIIRSLVCCCCYDLKFTLADTSNLLSKIFSMFFFFFFFQKENEESMFPSQTKQWMIKILNIKCMNVLNYTVV